MGIHVGGAGCPLIKSYILYYKTSALSHLSRLYPHPSERVPQCFLRTPQEVDCVCSRNLSVPGWITKCRYIMVPKVAIVRACSTGLTLVGLS